MTRATQITIAVLVTLMLFTGSPAFAYHWDDEQENHWFMSSAGDEAVKRDGGECFNQTADSDGAHCVVLYGHVFDLRQPVPINVQAPAECAPNLAHGFTGDAIHTGKRNQFEMYSSPGFVEYSEGKCGGSGQEEPRLHPERGLSSDIRISPDVPIYGYWYLSADHAEFTPFGVGSGEDGEPSAGLMPCVTVRMQLWTQRHPGTGTLIAEGETTKTVLSTPAASGDTTHALHGMVDDVCPDSQATIDPEKVTEFQVAMDAVSDLLIPYHDAYVINIEWYQHDGNDPDDEPNIMQRDWNLYTGKDYPNRIVMAVEDSIRIDELRLAEINQVLWIRGSINTPWGSYDVDTANIRVAVFDEDGQQVPMEHMGEPRLDYSFDHDGHYKPVNVSFPWQLREEGLEPGEYTVRIKATNWQHTHDAVAETTFTLRDDRVTTKEQPEPEVTEEAGAPFALVAMTLVLVPLLRALGRRRA